MTGVVDELVEDALRELADESFQRQVWLASRGPLVGSFTECCCQLWDDSGLGDALDRRHRVYSGPLDERLRALHALLRRIDERRAPEAILQDPRLAEARSAARELLSDLRIFRPQK